MQFAHFVRSSFVLCLLGLCGSWAAHAQPISVPAASGATLIPDALPPTGAGAVEQTLEIPGAGPATALMQALGQAFMARQAQITVAVPPSVGMAGAIARARDGTAVLARISRRLTAEESKGLVQIMIAREAIVFVGGAGVSVKNLARGQVLDLFSGAVTNWRELGGRPGPVRVLLRAPGEVMLTNLGQQFPEFGKITFSAQGRVVARDFEVQYLLERFDWAVGFLTLGSAREVKGLRVFHFDGIEPAAANVATGKYPFHVELGLIHRDEAGNTARRFIEFARSAEGARIMAAIGVVPLPAAGAPAPAEKRP
jgi:phosphate transport system substrate-binding protein